MKLQLTCKLFDNDARYFIEPLVEINEIKSLILHRDKNLIISDKIKYKDSNSNFIFPKFKFFSRLISMIKESYNADAIIGIYEIPHGVLALIVGKLMKLPVIICVIGNPKYRFRNSGIRGYITNFIYKNADIITVTGKSSKSLTENKRIKLVTYLYCLIQFVHICAKKLKPNMI